MYPTLKRAIDSLSSHRRERQAQDGYAYAAGELLKASNKEHVVARLEAEADGAFDYSPFDQGMRTALSDWHNLVQSLGGAIITVSGPVSYNLSINGANYAH